MRNKTKQINFRLTENEYTLLNKKCEKAQMKISNFILNSALQKEIIIIDGLPQFYVELRKIGVNLNQLTKLCNEGRISSPDLRDLKREVNNIWQLLNSLTRKVV